VRFVPPENTKQQHVLPPQIVYVNQILAPVPMAHQLLREELVVPYVTLMVKLIVLLVIQDILFQRPQLLDRLKIALRILAPAQMVHLL
jgi:hypothetical protein